MKTAFHSRLITLSVVMISLVAANHPKSVDAQVIQLPTIRFFNVRTTVSVPDGGTISLGGVNRSSTGMIDQSIPGLGRPFFRNRAIGSNVGSTRSAASAKLIVMSEYEQAVLAAIKRDRQAAALNAPNGSRDVQEQADFITRNVGRTRKH